MTCPSAAVQELVEAVDAVGGRFLITADHGNAEIMTQHDKAGKVLKDKEGKPLLLTSHTLSPVRITTMQGVRPLCSASSLPDTQQRVGWQGRVVPDIARSARAYDTHLIEDSIPQSVGGFVSTSGMRDESLI